MFDDWKKVLALMKKKIIQLKLSKCHILTLQFD
jgi:hypothetical protein